MPATISFKEAIGRSNRRKIVLGNGFSIALRPDIFSYTALRERARPDGVTPAAWRVFEVLKTSDFEVVMRGLLTASELVREFGGPADLADGMMADVAALREVLVQTIALSHPNHPFEIDEHRYRACREFLSSFEIIYSLNYDLLLYWALMQEFEPDIKCDDGFRYAEVDEATYVTWDPHTVGEQNVYYLHGALHLFDAGSELQKFTWSKTHLRLIEQIRAAMEDGKFPHFVAESSSQEKLSRIRHSAYLGRGERSLYSIGGDLFTFGFAMSENDAHILRAIRKNKVRNLFVGLYGDPNSDENRAIEHRVTELAERRKSKTSVTYYEAEFASVWG